MPQAWAEDHISTVDIVATGPMSHDKDAISIAQGANGTIYMRSKKSNAYVPMYFDLAGRMVKQAAEDYSAMEAAREAGDKGVRSLNIEKVGPYRDKDPLISKLEYNSKTHALYITFNTGDIYMYAGVPSSVYEQLRYAYTNAVVDSLGNHLLSVGTEFWRLIRLPGVHTGSQYPYTKVASVDMRGDEEGGDEEWLDDEPPQDRELIKSMDHEDREAFHKLNEAKQQRILAAMRKEAGTAEAVRRIGGDFEADVEEGTRQEDERRARRREHDKKRVSRTTTVMDVHNRLMGKR